jgi:anaerobic selenocysteine-containing dehydrogenase
MSDQFEYSRRKFLKRSAAVGGAALTGLPGILLAQQLIDRNTEETNTCSTSTRRSCWVSASLLFAFLRVLRGEGACNEAQ